MYRPIQTGIPRALSDAIQYQESYPATTEINEVAYCFWSLDASDLPSKDFEYLVLPDGCIDIVFDTSQTPEFNGALIMTPSIQAISIRIRNDSSYKGIRLLPGAWRGTPADIIGSSRVYDILAGYDFVSAANTIRATDSLASTTPALETTVRQLRKGGIIESNRLIQLLTNGTFNSVQDMIATTGYSRRQLQRILHDSVGYTPHDFIKIVRFQRALRGSPIISEPYSDQSHFIRESKRITGMTPSQLRAAYLLTPSEHGQYVQ